MASVPSAGPASAYFRSTPPANTRRKLAHDVHGRSQKAGVRDSPCLQSRFSKWPIFLQWLGDALAPEAEVIRLAKACGD
jgi:hypothetical protein